MHKEPMRAITDREVETFRTDGVVLLKGLFAPEWIEGLKQGVELAMREPGPFGKNLVAPGETGMFFMDFGIWMRHPFFRELALESPAPAIAARLFGTQNLWWYDDQMFVKEPGTGAPTIFHQDTPHFKCSGLQVCALWLTVDHVDKSSGSLGYVRGSHLWGKEFRPRAFTKVSAQLYDGQQADASMHTIPPIDEHPENYDIVYFDYEPGDCSVHHGRTIHGAPGNFSSTRRRRAISLRYCGDDVRYAARPYAPAQPHLEIGQKEGDPIESSVHPKVWPR